MKQIIIIFILFILQLKYINAIKYPVKTLQKHNQEYIPPRKDVFLISCMDLRVLDNIAIFMEGDNLTNRYDHFILAGTSLGTHNESPYGSKWKEILFQHFEIAKKIHHIEDIYIIEHRDCGAYKEFLPNKGIFGDSDNDQQKEYNMHKHYSDILSEEFLKKYSTLKQPLKIKTFIMDLRGNVNLLNKY